MKRLTTAEVNQLIAEGKLPKYLLPTNPERADELLDRAADGTITPAELTELRQLWMDVEVTPELEEERAELARLIEEAESTRKSL